MANHSRSGDLRQSLEFQKCTDLDDGWGQVTPGAGPFETVFTEPANLTPRTGGEEITASRLSGRQPFVCRIRRSTRTAMVTTAWQIVDARNRDRVFAIKSPPTDPDGKNAWLEFLIELGAES